MSNKSIQTVEGVKGNADISQSSDAEQAEQSVKDVEAKSVNQKVKSGKNILSFGGNSAVGIWGIIALVVVVIALAAIKLLGKV